MITAQPTTAGRGNRSAVLCGVRHKKHASKEVCACVQTKANTVAHGWKKHLSSYLYDAVALPMAEAFTTAGVPPLIHILLFSLQVS